MKLKSLFLAIGFILFFNRSSWAEGNLVIYTYSSFPSEWGPGPVIQKKFEAQCQCKIEWVVADDGGALLSRLQLEGQKSRADIVLGLDNNLAAEAKKLDLFVPHGLDGADLHLPIEWKDDVFLPFDYGFFSFVYDKQALAHPPSTMKELVENSDGRKIIIEDPRSSTPGLGLLLWVKALYGDRAPEIWQKLKPKILTVSKGWTEAYNLFLKGEAPMVLSYSTSPAYHLLIDKTDRYAAALFGEGHYAEIELAGMTKNGAANPLAHQFMQFVLSTDFQDAIPEGNWMYPVTGFDRLPPVFKEQPIPANSFVLSPEEIAKSKAKWLAEWLDVMGQ